MSEKGPDTTSSDYNAMKPYWDMVGTILTGTDAMRDAGEAYLPKFPSEDDQDYKFRRQNARFTNIFGDIIETLSAKPFANEITVEGTNGAFDNLLENIDGQGNHIHVFAANSFYHGVANAIDWILVDYTKNVPKGATVAVEKAMGARPYWVHVEAPRALAVYSETIAGNSVLTHFRLQENTTAREGYSEVTKERVRVFNREVVYNDNGDPVAALKPTWELFEKQKTDDKKDEWVSIGFGEITIGVIPLVPFISGRRKGASWQVVPPMKAAAFLQVEHYQEENGIKNASTKTAFPMLSASGVTPPTGDNGELLPVRTGPDCILFAPPGGEGLPAGKYEYLEPSATSLKFLDDRNDKTEQQLRELGRQPLTAQSGNITTITAAFAGDKAHTVIEAWAINFKDALENALKLTGMWLGQKIEPEVQINTDFNLSMREDSGLESLDKMRERNDISRATYWFEHKRRGILNPNFNADAELELILDEMPGDDDPDDIEDALPPQDELEAA